MGELNERIAQLESIVKALESKIADLTEDVQNSRLKPESKVPQLDLAQQTPLPSTQTGLGKLPGKSGGIIFNDAETKNIAFGNQPSEPTLGYNKHSHSRYAGGALDIHTLEIVEFENTDGIIYDAYGNPLNKHSQSYWKNQPRITKDDNEVEKISDLADNFVWDEENKTWRFLAVYAEEE